MHQRWNKKQTRSLAKTIWKTSGIAVLALAPISTLTSVRLAAASAPTRLAATDNIVGAGITGPYYLSRSALESYSETVVRDGERQVAGIDYVFDPTAGTLIFDSSLRPGESVTVRYWFNPANSHDAPGANSNGSLDVPMLGIGSTSIHMVGDYTAGRRGHEAPPAFSTLGMILSQRMGKANLVGARLIFNPRSPGGASPPLFSKDDATLQLTGQFVLAGLQLTGAGDFKSRSQDASRAAGAPADVQDTKLALQGNVAPKVALDAGLYQQHPAPGSTTGDDHVKVSLATSAGGNLTVSHADAALGTAGSTGVNEVSVDQKLNSMIHVNIDGQDQHSHSGDGSDTRQTGKMDLALTPGAGVSLDLKAADLTDSGVGTSTSSEDQNWALGGNLSNRITLDTGFNRHRKSHAHGGDHHVKVHLATLRGGSVSLSTAGSEDGAGVGATRTGASQVGLDQSVGAFLHLNVDEQRLSTDAQGHAASGSGEKIEVAVTPQKDVTIALNETKDKQPGQGSSDTEGATVSLDPSTALHLGAGYNTITGHDASRQSRTYDARLSPASAVSVSGSYVNRTSARSVIPDTAVVSATLKPGSLLNISGAYTQNPVDGSGNPQLSTERSVTFHSALAFLDLNGKYNALDPNGPARVILSRQFDLGINVNAATRLSGSYIYAGQKVKPDDGLYNYKLALSRHIGDLFSLDLAGVVQSDDAGLAGMRAGLKKNAGAKVGVTAHW